MKKGVFFLICLLVFLLPACFGFHLWSAKKNLEKTKGLLLSGDFEQAATSASQASRDLSRTKAYFSFFPFLERIAGLKDLIEIGESLAKTSLYLSQTGQSLTKAIGFILGEEKGDLEKTILEAKSELDLAWREISLLEGLLKKRPVVVLPRIGEKIKTGQDLLTFLPELVASSDKKTYLILLQNNMELRATGGFIGSYALVIFENGQLIDFQVEDVYVADGQLKGHVEPPLAIKKYLGEANWYLRDSNFDPDFPATAKKAIWFFQKETGRRVDGVIAVNLFVAQKILTAIGPVELADYQETITAENLFERAEYHSEVGFFPGSTQKRDFLGGLSQQIFQRLKEKTGRLKIVQALWQSLEEKQILVFLDNEEIQPVFQKYNWSGSIREAPDYLMVVESNFGVNKVNFFLKRKINWKINLGEKSEAKVILEYENKSPTQAWPGGRYKNYLRLYTPAGSRLLEVKINGGLLDLSQVEIFSASGKTVFALLVEVPVGETRKISFKYQTPLSIKDILPRYALLFQKQSGVGSDPLSILITYPASLNLTKIMPQALTGPRTILYNTDLSQDRFLMAEFYQ